jgi:hypothetical protein
MPDNATLDKYYEERFARGDVSSPFYGVYYHETKDSPNRATAGSKYYGPMQLGADAAKDLKVNRYNPYENIEGGLTFLKNMQKKYGDDNKALAAYNWGPAKLDRHLQVHGEDWYGKLPRQVRDYITQVRVKDPVFRRATEAKEDELRVSRPSGAASQPTRKGSLDIYDIQQMYGNVGTFPPGINVLGDPVT